MDAIEKKPKVSVCVVTYNQEKYIRQCLQSIVDQKTDFPFEVIVSDDCSTDGTRAIVRDFADTYPELIKPFFHEENMGAYKNYPFVHEQALGEYNAHIDGDDYWLPNKVALQVQFMENNTDCVAVYSNALVVSEEDVTIGRFTSNVKEIFDGNYLIECGNFLCNSSMMYKASLRDKIFPIDRDFIDYQVHINLAERGMLGFIEENLVVYRSNSHGSIIKKSNDYIRKLYLKALLSLDASKFNASSVYSSLAEFLAEAMAYELIYGSFSNYKKWLLIIKKDAPVNIFYLQISACFLFSKHTFKKIKYRLKKLLLKSEKNNFSFHPR
jgi:glycosyltransferase involved in cell wall biosynthesis